MNNDTEYWKDLEDSDYQISNLGRIRKTRNADNMPYFAF